MPRVDIDSIYMGIAQMIGEMSYAKRRRVGCVVVQDKNIVSFGYNGMPHGFENECEEEVPHRTETRLITKPELLHAESNAIAKLARSTQGSEGGSIYITASPCVECAKLIIQAGIITVYFFDEYRDPAGLELLRSAGIECHQIEPFKL